MTAPRKRPPAATPLKGVTVVSQRSGPLPSPDEMHGYSQIDPSFPDRIFGLTEKEQENERARDRALLDYHNRKENHDFYLDLTALIVCTVLCLVLIGAAIFMFCSDRITAGACFLGLSFISVPKFFLGRFRK